MRVTKMMFKQTMSFAQKGQIFHLHSSGKTLKQISEITNYPVIRLTFLIEGISGTNAWFDAITDYKGKQEDEEYTNAQIKKDKVNITEQSSRRRKANTEFSVSRTKTPLPKHNIKRRNYASRHKHNGDTGGSIGGNNDIINSLRKSKDYRGG